MGDEDDDLDWYVRFLTEQGPPDARMSTCDGNDSIAERWQGFQEVLDGKEDIGAILIFHETPHKGLWPGQTSPLKGEGRRILLAAMQQAREVTDKQAEEATEREVSLLAEAMEID